LNTAIKQQKCQTANTQKIEQLAITRNENPVPSHIANARTDIDATQGRPEMRFQRRISIILSGSKNQKETLT
jgi:hypothetical protein